MILGVIVVFVVRIVCGVTSGEIRLCVMMEGEWREKKKKKKNRNMSENIVYS